MLESPSLPRTLELDIAGSQRSWDVNPENPSDVYHSVWAALQPVDDASRRRAIDALRGQIKVDSQSGSSGSLTSEQLHMLAASDLIEIGAHTQTHPVLSTLSVDSQRAEIEGSKRWLRRPSDGRDRVLYPYGGPEHYDQAAVEAVRRAGFDVACAAGPGLVIAESNRLELPRLPVADWDADEFEEALRELLSPAATHGGHAEPGQATIGEVGFGSLRRLEPFSRRWGFDRGTPVDRFYIERFLSAHAEAIRGRVLEFGTPGYTHRFGGRRVSAAKVLDVTGQYRADYTCRLECGEGLPSDAFDCVIATQVLQLIYEVESALQTLQRILKPGGTLLATVPGISRIDQEEAPDGWFWSFTGASIRRLLAKTFGAANIEIESFGNVLATTAFLYGLAASELTTKELEHHDPDFEMIIVARAAKPGARAVL